MLYTKEERHLIYETCLPILQESYYTHGLCSCLSEATEILKEKGKIKKAIHYYNMMEELCLKETDFSEFPELVCYRPENVCKNSIGYRVVDFWFPQTKESWCTRIEILKYAIENTK